jgi:quercetin dioxygenase-like cupin family protein
MSTEEAESTNHRQIGRETVVQREGLEVLRLVVPAGSVVPEHHAAVDVVVVVVGGSGVFTVAGEPRRIGRGEAAPRARGRARAASRPTSSRGRALGTTKARASPARRAGPRVRSH